MLAAAALLAVAAAVAAADGAAPPNATSRTPESGVAPESGPAWNPPTYGDLPTHTDDYNYGEVDPEDEWDKSMATPTATASPAPANVSHVEAEEDAAPLTASQVEEQDKEEASVFLAIFACIIILVVGSYVG